MERIVKRVCVVEMAAMGNPLINALGIVLPLIISAGVQAEGVPVHGRRELLEKCRSAIVEAKSLYPTGRVRGTVAFRSEVIDIHELAWSGTKTYADFSIQRFESSNRKGKKGGERRRVTVENESEIFSWSPSRKTVARYPLGEASLRHPLQIARGNWFMFQDTSIELERLLDADNPKGSVTGFKVEQKDDLVFITREDKNTGMNIVFKFDLDIGALPISYHSTPTFRYSGKYKWKMDGNKTPVPVEYSWSRDLPKNGDDNHKPEKPAVPHFAMVIHKWAPRPKLEPAKFKLEGLKVPEDTEVEVYYADGVKQIEVIGGHRPKPIKVPIRRP